MITELWKSILRNTQNSKIKPTSDELNEKMFYFENAYLSQ